MSLSSLGVRAVIVAGAIAVVAAGCGGGQGLTMAGPGSSVVVTSEALYTGVYGRMRDVVGGPDGAVYVSTSNGGTDVILRIGR